MKIILSFLYIFAAVSLGGCVLFQPKYNLGTVTLKDGTILEGSTFIITNYSFKFKDAKTGKRSNIKNDNVQSLTKRFDDNSIAKYETLLCGGQTILVRIIVSGRISVYQYQVKKTKTRYVNNGSNNSFVPYDYIETFWFVKKDDEPCNSFQLKGIFSDKLNEEYKEYAQKLYEDVPELLNKIGTEGYKYTDFIRNIKEYNLIKGKQ